jgi:hypothetical protein
MNLPLYDVCTVFSSKLPGLKFRWKEEFIEESVSYVDTKTGFITAGSLQYYVENGNGMPYHRYFVNMHHEEKIVTAKVNMTLFGPRLYLHSRMIYET